MKEFQNWTDLQKFWVKILPHSEFFECIIKQIESFKTLDSTSLVLEALRAQGRLIDNLAASKNPDQIVFDAVTVAACMTIISERAQKRYFQDV